MDTKRFYIKATGSICYNETGIIFPSHIPFDFKDLLSPLHNPEMKWQHQFGWINQPKVLTFRASEKEAKEVNEKLPIGLIVSEHWEE